MSLSGRLRRLSPGRLAELLSEAASVPALRAKNRVLGDRVKQLTSEQKGLTQSVERLTAEVEQLTTRVKQLVAAHDTSEKEVAAIPPRVYFDHLPVNRQELKVPTDLAPYRARQLWSFFTDTLMTDTLVPLLLDKFRGPLDEFIQEQWPDAVTGNDFHLQTQTSRILLRRPGYVIKPHRDPRWSFITCLVYLPKRRETRLFGTQLCRLLEEREADSQRPLYVEPEDCEVVSEVPGKPNTALIFLNSKGVHSASIPEDAPADLYRYLYQLQLGPDWQTAQRLLASMSEEAAGRWRRGDPAY